MKNNRRIALVGGGPSALFILKQLVESGRSDVAVDIFERKDHLGQGMPYSQEGANAEHITNVSGNELPDLPESLTDWVRSLPQDELELYGLDQAGFDEHKILPRLLFGRYLETQFDHLLEEAARIGMETCVHLRSAVCDLQDLPQENRVAVHIEGGEALLYNAVVVCSGHNWPKKRERKCAGYFDSPYPPAKLPKSCNHSIAIRGGSLTAIDAIRTLSRHHGRFRREDPHTLTYQKDPRWNDFKIVMHTRNGMLPCVRFHLDDPQVSDEGLLQREELERARCQHDGFIPLDLVFEEDFKKVLAQKDPQLYERIRALNMEEFVELAMDPRERSDPFEYFQAEYRQALKSLAKKESIAWKEVLAILSFAVNYPAKHFCAEDFLRLRQVLLPLVSIVIAFIPQSSCQEILALHQAGCLELISVGSDSEVEIGEGGTITYRYRVESGESRAVSYETFIDCVGQPHLPVDAFPFKTLADQRVVRQARLTFRSPGAAHQQKEKDSDSVAEDADGSFHLIVPGIAINDDYQPLPWKGPANPRVYIMAVPYIGGHNPDYSGLDFCEEASKRIVKTLLA